MSLNRVILIGRLTRDPEMRYTPSGVAVATMGIAVDRFSKNDQGEYETDFFNIVAWRRTAEFAQNYLSKGRLISVDGRLQTRSWVAQDGTKRTNVEIVADSIQGLDRRQEGQTPGESSDMPAPAGRESGGFGGREPVAAHAARTAAAPAVDDIDESDPFADD